MRIRFLLSLQNLAELLHECGIEISHGSVRFWWNRFGQMFAADIRRQRRSLFDHAHQNRTATGQCRDEQGLHAAGGDGETPPISVSVGATVPSFVTTCQRMCVPRWKPMARQFSTVASVSFVASAAADAKPWTGSESYHSGCATYKQYHHDRHASNMRP